MAGNVVSGMLRLGLHTRVVGRKLSYFRSLSSTMDEAARQAQNGVEEGAVVLSEEQTSGRGRFQRTWVSQVGNLYLSIVLRPSRRVLQYLSIISAVATVRAIRETTSLQPTVKWPNDIKIGGKKVSGILVEDALQADEVQYAIVGIGVNVAFEPPTVDGLAGIATSLNNEADAPVDRELLLGNLLQEMDGLYISLRPSHARSESKEAAQSREDTALQRVRAEWRGLLETLGTDVEVRWGDESYIGRAEDVDEVGNLLLRQRDGVLVTLLAGEVFRTLPATPELTA